MAKIFPFRGYRYSPEAGPADRLLTQPYDKISPEMQANYYQASPHNFVRLIKGQEKPGDDAAHNVYTRAAADLEDWIRQGVLVQEPEPAFYPYFQEFEHPETGQVFERRGFIGLTEAVGYEKKVVHRHERTHSGPKLDRLRLTRHTKAHFGQLFMLYDDPEFAVDRQLDEMAAIPPLLEVRDEFGVRHRLWKITDPSRLGEMQHAMESKNLLVADGHHRYETALAYARENPGLAGAGKVMMTFVNLRSPGLVVLATHRLLDGLPGFSSDDLLRRAAPFFEIEPLASAAQLLEHLDSAPRDRSTIGLAADAGNTHCLLRVRPEAADELLAGSSELERQLDVVILHKLLLAKCLDVSEEDVRELKNIRYQRGARDAIKEVHAGRTQLAFLLRPVSARQVAGIAFAGSVMPQKSTDFFPKLLSGLTTYRLG